jgi:hypothetical protein
MSRESPSTGHIGHRYLPCFIAQHMLSLAHTPEHRTELEEDGRWLAEVPQFPGVLAYGATAEEAATRGATLALVCSQSHSMTANGGVAGLLLVERSA